jgi:hypothetical protein
LRQRHCTPPYTPPLKAAYVDDLTRRPPSSPDLPDPAESRLNEKIRGDVSNPAEPSQQKPSTWEHDPECQNYVAVEGTDEEESGEDEEDSGEVRKTPKKRKKWKKKKR